MDCVDCDQICNKEVVDDRVHDHEGEVHYSRVNSGVSEMSETNLHRHPDHHRPRNLSRIVDANAHNSNTGSAEHDEISGVYSLGLRIHTNDSASIAVGDDGEHDLGDLDFDIDSPYGLEDLERNSIRLHHQEDYDKSTDQNQNQNHGDGEQDDEFQNRIANVVRNEEIEFEPTEYDRIQSRFSKEATTCSTLTISDVEKGNGNNNNRNHKNKNNAVVDSDDVSVPFDNEAAEDNEAEAEATATATANDELTRIVKGVGEKDKEQEEQEYDRIHSVTEMDRVQSLFSIEATHVDYVPDVDTGEESDEDENNSNSNNNNNSSSRRRIGRK